MISKSNFLLIFKQKKFLQILLVIICIIPFISGLDSIPPLDRDESRFTQSSYQMIQSNDYININFQDEIRAKKPIGIYWIQVASAKIFGVDKISSYRIPSSIAALISVITLWFFSKLLFGVKVSLLITLLFLTNFLFVSEAHIAKTDSALLSTICLQQFFLFLIFLNKESNLKYNYIIPTIMWIFFSIGVLIKGPISLIIFSLTIISFSIVNKNTSLFLKIRPFIGLLVGCAIILPWFLIVQETTGGLFLQKSLGEDFIPKLITQQEGHGAYPGFYILISSIILWPIACFIPISIFFIIDNKNNIAVQFLLCWIIPYWLVLEFVPTKLIHYPLPIIPPLIMLVSASILSYEEKQIKFSNLKLKNIIFSLSVLLGLGGIILGSVILFLALKFGKDDEYLIIFISILIFLLTLIIFFLTLFKNFTLIYKKDISLNFLKMFEKFKSFNLIIILSSCVYVCIFGFVIPNLSKLYPSQSIYSKLKTIKYDTVSVIGYHEPSLVFLLKGNVILSNPNEGAIFLAEGKNNLVLIEERQLESFKSFAKNLDLNLREISNIEGYNYSKGNNIKIFFYKTIH